MFDRRNIHWLLEVVARPVVNIECNDLEQLISDLSADFPQFMAILDWESAAILIGGCDERQLEENLKLLRSKLSCDVQTETPQVSYRETINKAVEVDYIHQKTVRGIRQFARVKIFLEPLEDKFVVKFENKCALEAVPRKHIASVEKGISAAHSVGPIAGFPMLGLKVSLVGGAYHEEESSMMAFEIASHAAFRAAVEKAGPTLLEPIVKVEVVTPKDSTGDILGDLNSRRGAISGVESVDKVYTITALLPVTQMFGFTKTLEDLSQGRGSYSAQFSHYDKVPTLPDDDPLWPEPAIAALRA